MCVALQKRVVYHLLPLQLLDQQHYRFQRGELLEHLLFLSAIFSGTSNVAAGVSLLLKCMVLRQQAEEVLT